MKLSHFTLSALFLAASASYAQQEPKPPKTGITKEQPKRPIPKEKAPTGSAPTTKRDTLKGTTAGTHQPRPVTEEDRCPRCGMG